MFGNATKLAEANRRIADLEKELQTVINMAANNREQYHAAAKLVDIRRDGRSLHFTFVRNGQAFMIETMGLMSDNVTLWKTQAGLTS